MPSNSQLPVDCSCDVQIRTFPNRIEYLDKQTLIWMPLYPNFRLYPSIAGVAVLLANDGKNLTFEAGCSISIDGTVYTDFNLAYEALLLMISATLIPPSAGEATAANQVLEIAELTDVNVNLVLQLAQLTAIYGNTSLGNWDKIIGNSKQFTWIAGSLGGFIVQTIEYYTGVSLILTQTFVYDANDNITSITAS